MIFFVHFIFHSLTLFLRCQHTTEGKKRVFFFLYASVFLFHFLKIHYKCTRNVRRVNHKVITYLLKIVNKINKLRSNFKERKSKCDLLVL